MAIIKSITLKNFRTFPNLDGFELRPLNILIGQNGSGKSNFLHFFRLLSRASDGQLTKYINRQGGFDDIRWKGTKDSNIEWQIQISHLKNVRDPYLYYNGQIASRGNGFAFTREELAAPYDKNGHDDGYKFLGAYNGYLKYLSAKNNNNNDDTESEGGFDYNDQESAFAVARNPKRYPVIEEVRNLLTDLTVFRGFGENALDNIHNSQSLDVVFPLRLDTEGKNLVSVLYSIVNDVRYENIYEQLNDTLKLAFPEFQRLTFPLTATNKVELRWRDSNGWEFTAMSLSDGILRFLGLVTLLLLPDPPALIAIDEPEIGLHPKLLPILADLLKSASTRTQIVVTTHSPELLNAEAIKSDDIVLVERKNGETLLERPDRERLHRWLDRYTIGNLWLMNKLAT